MALHSLDILDTPPDPAFDRITHLAKRLFGCPIVLVSLVDDARQWFKSAVGLDVEETPRELAFCAHAILESTILEVSDASKDPRFSDNRLVKGEPWIRFYAGAPLEVSPGVRLGTLCLIDRRPRTLSSLERGWLRTLADTVVDLLRAHRCSIALSSMRRTLEEEAAEARAVGEALEQSVALPLARLHTLDSSEGDEAHAAVRDLAERARTASKNIAALLRTPVVSLAALQEVDVASIVADVVSMLKTVHRDTTVDVSIEVEPVSTEPAMIHQVFFQLLDNAFRHGASQIVVRAQLDDGWWVASVADDGAGIPPERIVDVFGPCVSLAGRDGMGLTLARRLIRTLGGRLWLDAEQIGGTIVRFELPQLLH